MHHPEQVDRDYSGEPAEHDLDGLVTGAGGWGTLGAL
jgi:hypothetical protein